MLDLHRFGRAFATPKGVLPTENRLGEAQVAERGKGESRAPRTCNTRSLGTIPREKGPGPVHATCLRSKELINRHTYAYGIWEGIGCVLVYLQRGATQNTTDTAKKGGELLPVVRRVAPIRFRVGER